MIRAEDVREADTEQVLDAVAPDGAPDLRRLQRDLAVEVVARTCGDVKYVVMVHHGQGGAQKNFYEKVMPTIAIWTTPTWVWENDNGNGPGSHCLTTNYTKCWLQELGVTRQFRNVNDIILQ